jgi:hypothetical protein
VCDLLLILRSAQDSHLVACIHVMNEFESMLISLVSLKAYYKADILAVTKTGDPPAISRLIFIHLST